MKIETNQKENVGIPIAFIDNVGSLWFRSKDQSDVMDNEVFIINTGDDTTIDYYNMDDFVSCVNRYGSNSSYIYAVKKFYEGDSITITF